MKRLLLFLFALTCALPSLAQTNTARMLAGVNAQAGASYTLLPIDSTRLTTFNNAGSVSVTLPSGATAGYGAGTLFSVRNLGTGTVTITVASPNTIDGSSTATLLTGAGADIYSDGANYETNKGGGGGDNPAFKGPNPWADVSRFGGYFGPATPVTTTGSIISGTNLLTLGSAQDFVNGNGLLLLGAGAAPTIATPSGLTVAPGGVTGSTTYNYVVVREDYFGGRTASSASAASTTSVATLGLQTLTLSGCNRVSGVVTCTTSAPHNFQAGYQANISGTNSPKFEGAVTIVTVPTATTFTYSQYGFEDSTGVLTSGNVQVFATNRLKWNSDSTNTVLKSYIYRCTASCGVVGPNYVLAGVSVGVDGYFEDRGYSISPSVVGVGDVSATAPTTASNQYLATTITAGGGTTSLTLVANATNTVAGATILHDNSPNVILACNSFISQGGTVYVPNSNVAANYFPIYSNLDLHGCPKQTQLLFANKVWQNATIINAQYTNLKGAPSGTGGVTVPFNQTRPVTTVLGFAYPFVYVSVAGAGGSNESYDDLGFFCNQSYQPCLYQDQITTQGSIAGVRYENLHLSSNNGRTTPLVIKGGFNFFFSNGGWANNAASFGGMPAALFSMNCGIGNSSQQLAYLVNTQYTYVFGGIVYEMCNNGAGVNAQIIDYSFRDVLIESSYVPFLRLSNQGSAAGNPYIRSMEIVRAIYADQVSGQSTPLVDASYGAVNSLKIQSPNCPYTGTAVSVSAANVLGVQGIDVNDDNCGGTPTVVGSPSYVLRGTYNVNAEVYAGVPLVATGTGAILYQMAQPAALQSAVVSAGGLVPVGAHTYGVEAFDYSGRGTIQSPTVSATTTGGNQTVTLTMPASFPAGAQGVKPTRDGVLLSNTLITTPGATYSDSAVSAFGSSLPNFTVAGQNSIDVNGITASSLRLACTSGYTTPFSGAIGCDSTTGLYHGNVSAVDNIFGLAPTSLSITPGDVVTWSSQGQLNNATPVGGGTGFLKCDNVPSSNNGDIFRMNLSGHCQPATPGIPGRVVTNSGTLSGGDLVSCTSGTGDRGSTIIFTNASAVVETLPNPASGACGSNFSVTLFWQGAAGGTLKATTATVNGIAGATGIVIPGNTWVIVISHDNVNYDVYMSRGIKCGTGLIETLNADMTVSCTASAHSLSGVLNCSAASASGTAYTCSTTPSFTPADGDSILFEADVANTGAATLNVNSSSAAPLKKQGGGTALVANDLLIGQDTLLVYDGTNWQMQGQTGNASAGGSPTWDAITSAAGNLSLSNAGFNSTFNHTSSTSWTWANTTAATVTVPQPAPSFTWSSQYWATGAVTGTDTWKVVPVLVAGLNGTSTLAFSHTGTTGAATVSVPSLTAGIGNITAFTFVSTATTGSAPFVAASTTAVANLTVQRINPLFVGGVAVVGAGIPAERYNTAATSQTASIGSTTMVTAPAADTNYEFSAYVGQLNAGTSCTGAGSVGVNIIYTDPVTGSSYTFVLDTQTSGAVALTTTVPLTNGALTVSNVGDFKYMFRAKASTTVNYSTTYTPGATCSPGQAYNIYPVLLEK